MHQVVCYVDQGPPPTNQLDRIQPTSHNHQLVDHPQQADLKVCRQAGPASLACISWEGQAHITHTAVIGARTVEARGAGGGATACSRKVWFVVVLATPHREHRAWG